MANHGYIVDMKKPLDWDILLKLSRDFCINTMKDVIRVDKHDDSAILISGKDTDDCVQFWIEDDWRENINEKIVTIRHGHTYDVWWWVDFKFSNYIALELEGIIMDDGSDSKEPKENYLPTIKDWIDLKVKHIENPIRKYSLLASHLLFVEEEFEHYPNFKQFRD